MHSFSWRHDFFKRNEKLILCCSLSPVFISSVYLTFPYVQIAMDVSCCAISWRHAAGRASAGMTSRHFDLYSAADWNTNLGLKTSKMIRFWRFKRLVPLKKACPTAWSSQLVNRTMGKASFWTKIPFRPVAMATDTLNSNLTCVPYHFLWVLVWSVHYSERRYASNKQIMANYIEIQNILVYRILVVLLMTKIINNLGTGHYLWPGGPGGKQKFLRKIFAAHSARRQKKSRPNRHCAIIFRHPLLKSTIDKFS